MMTEAQKRMMDFLNDSRAYWMQLHKEQSEHHREINKRYQKRLRESAQEIMSLENQLADARAEIAALKETIASMERNFREEE